MTLAGHQASGGTRLRSGDAPVLVDQVAEDVAPVGIGLCPEQHSLADDLLGWKRTVGGRHGVEADVPKHAFEVSVGEDEEMVTGECLEVEQLADQDAEHRQQPRVQQHLVLVEGIGVDRLHLGNREEGSHRPDSEFERVVRRHQAHVPEGCAVFDGQEPGNGLGFGPLSPLAGKAPGALASGADRSGLAGVM